VLNQTGTSLTDYSHNIGNTYSQDMGNTFFIGRCTHALEKHQDPGKGIRDEQSSSDPVRGALIKRGKFAGPFPAEPVPWDAPWTGTCEA